MNALGIIPARAGSKRLRRKNLRTVGGKPLILRAIEAARASTGLYRIVVSSDDDEVLDLAATIDPSFPLRRPGSLATDTSPAIDYVRHALATAGAAADAVVIIQPSSPFTLTEDIDATICLLERSGADSAVSVTKIDHAIHPLKLKRMDGDRLLPFIEEEQGRMAEHQLPPVYVRNGSVYATLRTTIEAGSLLGTDCRAYIMPRERSLDINDEVDLALAEVLMARAEPCRK